MYLKSHIVRVENIKMLQAMHAAKIDHKVIALFMRDLSIWVISFRGITAF